MSDVLPLLVLPALLGLWFAKRRRRHSARQALGQAIARGRVMWLSDAGVAPVTAVARSLEVAPAPAGRRCPWWLVGRRRSAWDVQQLVAPLGLTLDEVIGVRRDRLRRMTGFTGASRFSGRRHDRDVCVVLGVGESSIELATGVPMPEFRVEGGGDGRLTAFGSVPIAVEAALQTLAPSRHWRGVHLAVEGAAVRLWRDRVAATSWLHDLWLAEFLADLAAPAPQAATATDLDARYVGAPDAAVVSA